jgi:UDP-N-acetyl-D-glucosamine dehydrogenase
MSFRGPRAEHLVPYSRESGLEAGRDFHLAFSPERVDPGRTDYTLRNTPKVVGGLTPACTDARREVYGRVCDHVVPVSTPEVAELSKLLENIFRSVNIALVNELAILADRMGSTSGRSSTPRRPSRSASRASSPARAWAATASRSTRSTSLEGARVRLSTEFIELAGKVNKQMPAFCMEKIERSLNDAAKPVRGSRVLSSASSYKGGRRRSARVAGAEIIELLRKRGARRRLPRSARARAPAVRLRSVEPSVARATSP